MPKSKRGRYYKPRYLALEIRYKVPRNVTKGKILRTLIASVESGRYRLPRGWRAAILWRNKRDAEMKIGRWQNVLNDSAQASPGFDTAVINYLENQL